MENSPHIPVLLKECIEGLNIKEHGVYLDLTLGRAGHSSEILKRLSKPGLLIGFDQDDEAISYSENRLASINNNFRLYHSNFVNAYEILKEEGITEIDGILMDLGVSSPQFDDISRGFTYRYDTLLDMRMDKSQRLTAREIVNTYSLEELTRIFREYGEEKFAFQIAKNIVKEREKESIDTTFQLVEIIKKSKPAKELKKPGHPAKQTFQALRIAVNDELNVLYETLKKIPELLKSGGRLAVITFHSLEDRIVKTAFKNLTTVEGNRFDLPIQQEEAKFRVINKKVIIADEQEQAMNHRSVSAKLRIIEKI